MDDGTARVGALIVTTTERAACALLAARSVGAHHPELHLTVVVVDDRFGEVTRCTADEPGRWTSAAKLIGSEQVAALIAEHHIDDVVTLVQPQLVANLLDTDAAADAVLVLADHVELHAPVTDFIGRATAKEGGFVPVRSGSVPVDGRLPDAADLASYGHFQRGLAVFTRHGRALVNRWADALSHHPLEGDGRFARVEQAWFDDLVLSDPAAVHIDQPSLVQSFRNLDECAKAAGAVATSYEGFSAARPWVLSELAGEWPRVIISAHPMLRDAVETRAQELESVHANCTWMVGPYDTLPNGHRYDEAMRLVFTEALHHALRHGGELPPNPFTDAEAFVAFLAARSTTRPGISRHLEALARRRPDLATSFADDDGALRKWAGADAVSAGIWSPRPAEPDDELSQISARRPYSTHPHSSVRIPTRPESGLNVVGLLSAQLGIGEQGRLALRAIKGSAIPYSVIDHDDTVHRREPAVISGEPAHGFRYDIDVLLLNADQIRSTVAGLNRQGKAARPTVGLWAWESPVFPQRFHHAYQFVSEVWVATSYIKETLMPSASAAGVPVHVLPLQFPYVNPRGTFSDPALLSTLGLHPARPYFAFMFDYFSVAERKQPWLAVEAFRRAFPHQTLGGPQMVVKSLNHEFFPLDRERLLRSVGGRSDVLIVEQYLLPEHRTALIAGAAGYVSLHRAEGLGLTMAEAMGAGTPVVATGWSGNMEFMTHDNSWLVDAELVDIPQTIPHYGGAGQWAHPSVDQAAAHLRAIVEDPAAARTRAERAVADLNARNSSGADAVFVVDRVRALRSLSAVRAGSETGHPLSLGAGASNVPGGTS